MPEPLIYVDTSEVREGKLEQLRGAIKELAAFVEDNEPQILSYTAYLSDDGTRMTVVHLHTDSASLELHGEVAGPEFKRFADLVRLTSIRVYGEPNERVVEQLREKGRMLGTDDVSVLPLAAGFARFGAR